MYRGLWAGNRKNKFIWNALLRLLHNLDLVFIVYLIIKQMQNNTHPLTYSKVLQHLFFFTDLNLFIYFFDNARLLNKTTLIKTRK